MDGGPSKTITPARIVSLAPSVTETLFALGLEDNIAGVSDVCDYPAEAKEIPKVGGMKNPSLESIVRLRPDIVIMTKDGNSGETKEKLDSLGIEVFAFSARTITEYTDELLRLGERLDVGEKAKEIAAELNSELNKIKARHRDREVLKKALIVIWPKPLIVAGPGTQFDEALSILKVENIAKDAKMMWPKFSLEEAVRRDPDFIISGPSHSEAEQFKVSLKENLAEINAVKDGRVYFVGDGLYRLGPRSIEGILEIERIIYDTAK